MPNQSRTATTLATNIVNDRIAQALDPAALIGDAEFMIEARDLIDKLGGKDLLPLKDAGPFEDDLKATASPALHARYIKLSDANGALGCAYFSAGFLLGVELGRAIPKGGR